MRGKPKVPHRTRTHTQKCIRFDDDDDDGDARVDEADCERDMLQSAKVIHLFVCFFPGE